MQSLVYFMAWRYCEACCVLCCAVQRVCCVLSCATRGVFSSISCSMTLHVLLFDVLCVLCCAVCVICCVLCALCALTAHSASLPASHEVSLRHRTTSFTSEPCRHYN